MPVGVLPNVRCLTLIRHWNLRSVPVGEGEQLAVTIRGLDTAPTFSSGTATSGPFFFSETDGNTDEVSAKYMQLLLRLTRRTNEPLL